MKESSLRYFILFLFAELPERGNIECLRYSIGSNHSIFNPAEHKRRDFRLCCKT